MDRTSEYLEAVSIRDGPSSIDRNVPVPARVEYDSFVEKMDVMHRLVDEMNQGMKLLQESSSFGGMGAWKKKQELEQIEGLTRRRIQACQKMLDRLEFDAKSMSGDLRPHERAHLHGMLLIESERLARSTRQFDLLRGERLQRITKERHLPRNQSPSKPAWSGAWKEDENISREDNDPFMIAKRQEIVQRKDHNARSIMLEELEMARETHRALAEVSALNHLFSTEVVRQSQQIEAMYEDALVATKNFDVANVHLKKTIERSGNGQYHILIFFLIASMALLFLDWCSK